MENTVGGPRSGHEGSTEWTRAGRRLWVAFAIAALPLVAAPAEAPQEHYPIPGHPGHRITVRGKQLYVEMVGPEHAPTLVYVHGGPGAGAYPFDLLQRQRLSRDTRLVVFDQRGTLRSEPVADDEPFVLNDLVEDLEALRLELHVARWTPIAHSFAGLIAMRYALAHPTSVDKLVFDDPTFDIAASDRAMLEMLAEGYDRAGMPDPAAEARAAALRPMTPRECWQTFSRMGAALGTARRLDLYAHSLAPGYFFQWMRDSGLPEENWLRGSGPSQQTLWKDETVFESLVPRLHELRAPMLLLKGRYDFNTSQDQLDAFKALPNGRVVTFENSAHLPWAEEPDRFADVIRRFVHGK